MLLVGSGGSRSLDASGANASAGDIVNLHFSVPTKAGEKHFRMEAIICRVLGGGTGMGVRFEQPLDGAAWWPAVDADQREFFAALVVPRPLAGSGGP
jgi:hypothetical protein